jgi:hypothetical protein
MELEEFYDELLDKLELHDDNLGNAQDLCQNSAIATMIECRAAPIILPKFNHPL